MEGNDVVEFLARARRLALPVARMILDENDYDQADEEWPPPRSIRGRNADSVSPSLFYMIRAECTCKSVLSGWETQGCQKLVDQCNAYPDQAFFVRNTSGRTPLHEACLRSSCSHVIKALLTANPVCALERDQTGSIPIHLVFDGHRYTDLEEMDEVVEALLAINPGLVAIVPNNEGATALTLACTLPMTNTSVIARLLHANPSCAECLDFVKEATPLHFYVLNGEHHDLEGARCIIDAYHDALSTADRDRMTPLHVAASKRNTEMICFLLALRPDVARFRDSSGRTALHALCSASPTEENLPAIAALIEAAPETLHMVASRLEQTPLHMVCLVQRPNLEAIKLLATYESAMKTDLENCTALHYACEGPADVAVVRFLLSVYSMATWITTRKHDTPLHTACGQNASIETIRLLIESNAAALTMQNDYGFTPLHCVCSAYHPRMGIVQALLDACPNSVNQRTNGGETALHLACRSGALVGVLQLLTLVQSQITGNATCSVTADILAASTTNKIGNSPLHEACFRGASFEHIEALAKATPEWIVVRNNAGYTPLQVMCKSGLLDERVVTAFSRMRGPVVFSVVDSTGHTPLHSACREGTSVAAIRSLIRSFPDALHMKTVYGDTPLHLSCLRRANASVVREIAVSSCDGKTSTLLRTNIAGQTPIGIVMDEFQTVYIRARICSAASNHTPAEVRAFDVLAVLVKLLYYGSSRSSSGAQSLVNAAVCLHRRDIRLDPAFILRAIYLYPEEALQTDDDGNHPLHIESSIPIEKMSLLDGPLRKCGGGGTCNCYNRAGVLGNLLAVFPEATKVRNAADEFPFGLMIQNGRPWDGTLASALRHFPPALHWYKGMDERFVPHILSKVSRECGLDTLYQLINSKPGIVGKNENV